MKTILITGVDGSGKSTLLDRLSMEPNPPEVILVPHINLDDLEAGSDLHAAAAFVNTLSYQSDQMGSPQLKAIALFASMVLFGQLLERKRQKGAELVYCERHPLVDAPVYANFYADKLGSGSVQPEFLQALDQQFSAELSYLLSLLPQDQLSEHPSKAGQLLAFIFQWFFVEKKLQTEQLKGLFGVELPAKFYFLQADPEELYARIEERDVKEAHESVEVFRQLDAAYVDLLEQLKQSSETEIETIDANSFAELDQLFERLR